MSEICSKLTIKTPELLTLLLTLNFTHCSGVSIVDFEQAITGWVNIDEAYSQKTCIDFFVIFSVITTIEWHSVSNEILPKPFSKKYFLSKEFQLIESFYLYTFETLDILSNALR